MPEIRFRPSSSADDEFFSEIEFYTTWESLSAEDRERLTPGQVKDALALTHELLLQREGNQVIIAEDAEGERVGLLWYGVNRNLVTGEDEAWIFNVTVAPDHQGQGIGKLLVGHAEELARAAGFHTLGLMVSSHNERAQRLYERLQFQPTNLLMRKRLVSTSPPAD